MFFEYLWFLRQCILLNMVINTNGLVQMTVERQSFFLNFLLPILIWDFSPVCVCVNCEKHTICLYAFSFLALCWHGGRGLEGNLMHNPSPQKDRQCGKLTGWLKYRLHCLSIGNEVNDISYRIPQGNLFSSGEPVFSSLTLK